MKPRALVDSDTIETCLESNLTNVNYRSEVDEFILTKLILIIS